MTHGPAGSAMGQWVASSKGQAVTAAAARWILKDIREKHLSLIFLNLERSAVENPQALLSEIQSALNLFLLEKDNPHLKGLAHDPNAAVKLRHWFVRFWIDRTRRPDQDRYRYLYKRMTTVLRDSTQFFTHSPDNKGTFFSLVSENRTTAPLCDDDLGEIDLPGELSDFSDFDSVNNKKTILALAAYFWRQVSEMFGNQPVWVKVNALMAWIGRTVSFENMLETARSLEDHPGNAPFSHRIKFREPTPYDPEMVRTWAKKAADALSEKERLVFYLRYGQDMGLAAIAGHLGSRGRSGGRSSYWLDKAHHRLKTFLRDLPWLSPEDLNEAAFSLFRETLLDHLKKTVLVP